MQQIKFCSLLFRSDVFYNIPLRLLCSRCAICCGSQNAPEQLRPNVTSRENTRKIGYGCFIGENVTLFIQRDLSMKQVCFRYAAKTDKGTVAWQIPEFTAPLFPNTDTGDPVCM